MIYLILFVSALVLLTILLIVSGMRARKHPELQSETEWYSIDLVALTSHVHHHARSQSRPLMRRIILRVLRWYRNLVNFMRALIRFVFQKLLHHYDERNDPAPRRSQFLDDMHEHKSNIAKNGKSELHADFPESE